MKVVSHLISLFDHAMSQQLLVKNLQFEDGKMIAAAQYYSSGSSTAVELTEEEKVFAEQMKVWSPLLLILGQFKILQSIYPQKKSHNHI